MARKLTLIQKPPVGATDAGPPGILPLGAPAARDPSLTGAKAANLARARLAGLPVLPGFVVATTATAGGRLDPVAVPGLHEAWSALHQAWPGALVVRSSSTVEDIGTSSMAGQFTSVLGVETWDGFMAAVADVLASSARPHDRPQDARPMAVLVQPQLRPVCGGVLFGVDPVTGDRHRLVVDAVPQGPDAVVGGAVVASHCMLSRRGRVLETAVWLLQSRPVTAVTGDATRGPLFGPGPVSETFPEPLRTLEVELWVEPLRAGIVSALETTGTVPRRHLAASPGIVAVGGRVAADLEMLGVYRRRPEGWRRLSPAGPARRLAAAWRVGRLRAALPLLAGDLVRSVDAELASIPPLAELDDTALLGVLDAARIDLRAVHGHEVLAGMLLAKPEAGTTAAGIALGIVERGLARGLTDEQVVARYPVALCLVAPSIGRLADLPALGGGVEGRGSLGSLGPREALRLRCRWLQELTTRTVEELASRLVHRAVLEQAGDVVHLTLAELRDAVDGSGVPHDLAERRGIAPGPPLPSTFRLTDDGRPVAEHAPGRGEAGMAAGGGRAVGTVRQEGSAPGPGRSDVLVVGTLDPRLSAELSTVNALVSETGSPLSHLAILAREMGVATVVAVTDARRRFPPGSRVMVDGATGEVRVMASEERASA